VTVLFLAVAAIPFIYYLIALYSAWAYFRRARKAGTPGAAFTPPVSNLKPIRGLDPGAYENFASFCRQDYPDYEIVFCVDGRDDPVLPVIEKLIRDFPQRPIRVLFGSGRIATNDKVAKLARMVGARSRGHER
jgi:ceramide glucosyltransferase